MTRVCGYLCLPYFQDTLNQVLQILLKSKLLVSNDEDTDLRPDSTLSLFLHYKKWDISSLVGLVYRVIFLQVDFKGHKKCFVLKSCPKAEWLCFHVL